MPERRTFRARVEEAEVPEKLTKAAVAMKIKSREPSEQGKADASKPDR